jgi:hypothetical protein
MGQGDSKAALRHEETNAPPLRFLEAVEASPAPRAPVAA